MTHLLLSRSTVALVTIGAIALSAPAEANAAFPGRDGRIAYEDQRSESVGSQLLSVLPDGSQPRTLLGFGDPRHTRAGGYAQPAYSPDGRRLAFTDTSYPHSPESSLYLVRASGREPLRHLTPSRNDKRDFVPSWAPDGHRLVFVRTRPHPCREQIRVYRAGRSRSIFSRSCGHELGTPVWSVRGEIAFGWRDAIYTMRPDGSHRRRVVAGYNPDWSPRGHWIVFSLCAGSWCGCFLARRQIHRLRLPASAPDDRFGPGGVSGGASRDAAARSQQAHDRHNQFPGLVRLAAAPAPEIAMDGARLRLTLLALAALAALYAATPAEAAPSSHASRTIADEGGI